MKNLLKSFVFVLSISLLINIFTPAWAEESTDDQLCDNAEISAADDAWYIKLHAPLSQTFTPTMNRLTSISLALEGGADINAAVKMELSIVGAGLVLSKTETTQQALVAWVDFTFPTVSIDTSQQYKITVTTLSNTAMWIVSTIQCYSGGVAFVDGAPKAIQDFGFVTYGYNYVPPTLTPAPTSTPIPTVILTPTPLVIVKPGTLEAVFVSEENGINLAWSESTTTDITGYNIYRSESESTGFLKIAGVEKGITEYLNNTDVEQETTYYFIVKAFKGETESLASPTAQVETPTLDVLDGEIVPETPISVLQVIFGQYLIFIIGGILLFLTIVIIIVYLIIRNSRKKKINTEPIEGINQEIEPEQKKVEEIIEEPKK